MPAYLLDTNIVSEVIRQAPEVKVIEFLNSIDDAYLSVITIHELYYGLRLLPEGRRRDLMAKAIEELLLTFSKKVLKIDIGESDIASTLRVEVKQQGRVLHLADSLIAATAKHHDLVLVTRNISDFEGVDIKLFNPWGIH